MYLGNAQADTNFKNHKKVQYLMYMDDIKLFIKNEKELENLIQAVRIYSEDKGMEFGIKMCHAQMKSGKQHRMECLELPNQEKIRTFEKRETYTYFGILEVDPTKHAEMRERNRKRIPQEIEKTTRNNPIEKKISLEG